MRTSGEWKLTSVEDGEVGENLNVVGEQFGRRKERGR